jgi:hypothetical protein
MPGLAGADSRDYICNHQPLWGRRRPVPNYPAQLVPILRVRVKSDGLTLADVSQHAAKGPRVCPFTG